MIYCKPTPEFIMMCGIPGSGKSTLAKKLIFAWDDPAWHYLSSDELRVEMYGEMQTEGTTNEVQKMWAQRNREVFKQLNETTLKLLEQGEKVIYDATNLSKKRRKELVKEIRRCAPDCVCKCVAVLAPVEECIARQPHRDHQVPTFIIKKYANTMEMPDESEGWDSILLYHSDYRVGKEEV